MTRRKQPPAKPKRGRPRGNKPWKVTISTRVPVELAAYLHDNGITATIEDAIRQSPQFIAWAKSVRKGGAS